MKQFRLEPFWQAQQQALPVTLSEARLASVGHSSVMALQQKARYLITVSFVVCTADTTEQRVDFTTLKFLTKQREIGFAFTEGKNDVRKKGEA